MAFHASNKEFEAVFGRTKSMTEEFLDGVREYLETRKKITPFSEIYDRLVNGKPLSAFSCRYDLAADMTEILGENNVPCLKVLAPSGKVGFIISSDDNDAVMDLETELARKASRFMPVFSGATMRSHLDGDTHKAVISLTGLTKTEVYLLEQYCQKETNISAMGIDEMADGTFKASFFADDVIRKGEKGMTLAQTVIRVKLLLASKYGNAISERINRKLKMKTLISQKYDLKAANNGRPLIIIGEEGRYIRLEEDYFEFGDVKLTDGRSEFMPIIHSEPAFPNYSAMLISCSNSLVNPIIAKDLHELAVAKTEESVEMSNAELKESMSQKAALAKIADMIESKLEFYPVMQVEGEYEKKLMDLIGKSRDLLIAAISGEYPNDYTEAEKNAYIGILEKNHVDMSDYREVLTELGNLEVSVEGKDIEKLQSLEEYKRELIRGRVVPSREELGL